MNKKTRDALMWIIGAALVVVCVISMAGTAKEMMFDSKKVGSIAEITVPDVPSVTTERPSGVISAEEWSKYYGDIYNSWLANKENTGHGGVRASYVDDDPMIKTLYDGIGFAFDYTEAIGHSYTLDDIVETTRPHKLANCLTCKTPDFTAMVNKMGTEAYSVSFDEMYAKVSEPVSCYTCHGNTPGTMVITHDYMLSAMGDEVASGKVDAASVSCAQCHIEYYFDPVTKAALTPYDSLDNFDPDSILAYYNEMGFVDFTNSNTGVGMIKAQHPEFETYYGAGSVHKGTYNCADCHMGVAYGKKGDPYANHLLTSPLDNPELLKSTCSQCHADLARMVKSIQSEVTEKEQKVGKLLVTLNEKLAAAVSEGKLSKDTLEQAKKLDRDAQFYWDFVYVENSEGAHNSTLSLNCLSKAEKLANQALELLK